MDSDISFYKINENLFYPRAINYGVKKATGDIITFCDPDTFFFQDWYTPLLNKLTSDESIGAVSSKLVNPLTDRVIDFGMSFTKWNAGHPTKDLKYQHPLASIDRETQAACSAILMTRKKLFESVGGMDERMPFAYPDCDYCLKLNALGYSTWVLANSIVYHKGSSDSQNSKYYSFGHLRTESKGMFYAENYHRISEDLGEWFKYSIAWARQQWPFLSTSYVLVDYSTIYNREYYYAVLAENGFRFLDKIVVTGQKRNAKKISIYGTISFTYIDMASPILYFMDSFTSLFDNALWFRMRDISRDLVIDRHGNVFPLDEIAKQNC